MTALQTIISRFGFGESAKEKPLDKRLGADRRRGPDRRFESGGDNVFLLHGTESRLQFAAREIGFGTYDFDPSAGEFRCSSELLAIAGLQQDETPLSLEKFVELIHPDDREGVLAAFKAAFDPDMPEASHLDERCRLLRPDGAVRQIALKGRTLSVGHGGTRQILGASGVMVDMTASFASEGLLERQAHLLDLVSEPLLAWDQRYGIFFWNAACEQLYGFSRAEALGQPCHELLKAEFPISRQTCLADLARNGSWSGQVRYLARDGRRIAVESRLETLKYDGKVSILEADRPLGGMRTPPTAKA